MIFITVIGGIGRIEGPIIGTVVFFLLRQTLADLGAIYLLILGAVAIVVMLKAPKGLWGLVADRYGWQVFPLERRLVIEPLTLHQLPVAERDVAHGRGREQLLDLDAAVGQPVLVRVLQQRVDRRPVLLDAVGIPVLADDLLLLLDQRLQPGERRLGRAGVSSIW